MGEKGGDEWVLEERSSLLLLLLLLLIIIIIIIYSFATLLHVYHVLLGWGKQDFL